MPKLVLVKSKIFWGYSIKYPTQTAAQDSIPIPPPTTTLGALAAPYAKYMKLPEALIIDGKTYSTAAKLLLDKVVKYCTSGIEDPNAVKYSDISRSIILPYQRYKERRFHFAAQSVSKIYAPSLDKRLLLAYLVNDNYVELVSKIAWGITSIGNKEGLISVDDVSVYDVRKVSKPVVETPFITPSSLAQCISGCIEVESCSLDVSSYSAGTICKNEIYLIPVCPDIKDLFGGQMKVSVSKDAAVVEITLNSGSTYIVLPKSNVDS